MKHSSAIWLGLGAAFLGVLTTFLSLLVSQRKKTTHNPAQPASTPAQEGLGQPT